MLNALRAQSYFSLTERVRDAFKTPLKHIDAFFEPEGKDYETALPHTDRLWGNTAMQFTAALTRNSIDMNTWHEMDATVHSQFGTVDNPVLVFTSDSSWR